MSDSGSPMWLLKFPRLRTTRYRASRNSLVTSFVVVLPALPVIATTFVPDSRRIPCASVLQRRRRVVDFDDDGVARQRRAASRTVQPRGTTTPAAPASIAAPANSAPSNRSPRIATYRSPACSVRVSIDTLPNSPPASPAAIAPAICAATHAAVRRMAGRFEPVRLSVVIAAAVTSRRSTWSAGAPALRARPRRRRTAARDRRSPGTSRVPCRPPARRRRAAPARSPWRSPRADRRS